jgi:hypothetical protein
VVHVAPSSSGADGFCGHAELRRLGRHVLLKFQADAADYRPNQAEPVAQTLEDRLKKTVYRPGQATINDTVNNAANATRNFNINNTIANASLPPALKNIMSQNAAGLSAGNFPSPTKFI